jgi:dihydropteroate synthase
MPRLRTLLQHRKRALVMGVVNVTPDSFSDGGLFASVDRAERHAEALAAEGADIIDVGAESTRPGAPAVSPDDQIARLGGLVGKLVRRGMLVSIDTTSPEVAARALDEGASIINSVSLDPAVDLGRLAVRFGAALVLMHSRGSMTAMKDFSVYDEANYVDVVADVASEWSEAAMRALDAGLDRADLLLDPGLGFAKSARHSLELCARLEELSALGFPVLVGPSRKSFIARIAAGPDAPMAPPDRRLGGTVAVAVACARKGAAVLRVHDVEPVRQALLIDLALEGAMRSRTLSADELASSVSGGPDA